MLLDRLDRLVGTGGWLATEDEDDAEDRFEVDDVAGRADAPSPPPVEEAPDPLPTPVVLRLFVDISVLSLVRFFCFALFQVYIKSSFGPSFTHIDTFTNCKL